MQQTSEAPLLISINVWVIVALLVMIVAVIVVVWSFWRR